MEDLYYHFSIDSNTPDRGVEHSGHTTGKQVPVSRVELNKSGWHGSRRAIDATLYMHSTVLSIRHLSGDVQGTRTRNVASECSVVCVKDVSDVLLRYMLWCGEYASRLTGIDAFKPAIEVKKKYLDGIMTANNVEQAYRQCSINMSERQVPSDLNEIKQEALFLRVMPIAINSEKRNARSIVRAVELTALLAVASGDMKEHDDAYGALDYMLSNMLLDYCGICR